LVFSIILVEHFSTHKIRSEKIKVFNEMTEIFTLIS
jgi:hypothetical protein